VTRLITNLAAPTRTKNRFHNDFKVLLQMGFTFDVPPVILAPTTMRAWALSSEPSEQYV